MHLKCDMDPPKLTCVRPNVICLGNMADHGGYKFIAYPRHILPHILNLRKDSQNICDELISTVVCHVLDGMPSPSTFGKTGPQITFRPSAIHKLLHTGLLDSTAGGVSTIYVLAQL